nr:hypothetical protein [Tanacetum cinerariifolium]
MVVPNEEGNGHSKEHIHIEYECKPPLCLDCHVFGHSPEQCPRKVIDVVNKDTKEKEVKDDGFTTVSNRRRKVKNQEKGQALLLLMFPMFSVATWNIRGLNRAPKQSEVFRSWDWSSNASLCDKGCRIIIGWNVDVVDLMVIAQSNQGMHVKVIHKTTRHVLFISFIYATNLPVVRRILWRELEAHKHVVHGCPWVLMGDFNVALNMEDYYAGSSIMRSDMDLLGEMHVGEKSGTFPNEPKPDPQSDDGEVEEMVMEPDTQTSNRKGASTLTVDVSNV